MGFGRAGCFTAGVELGALDGSDGFVLEGIDANDRSGYSVSTAGDVNGDGYADMLIGAYGADSYAGETYLIFGRDFTGSVTQEGGVSTETLTGS